MLSRSSLGVVALIAALSFATSGVRAFDDSKYPDWGGQWRRVERGVSWDPTKPMGPKEEPPLTPEYQAIFETNLKEQARGIDGTDPQLRCLPNGMPRQMTLVFPMEIVITPKITYMAFEHNSMLRRIYTDGRSWPEGLELAFSGYSIAQWIDEDHDGRYNVLEIETRNLKGPRVFDPTAIPLHEDNQTVVKERIYADKTDPEVLHNQVTTFDHALTRPWTVVKNYRRERNPIWLEDNCTESNRHVVIGKEDYVLDADNALMPTYEDQPPPVLRYFKPPKK